MKKSFVMLMMLFTGKLVQSQMVFFAESMGSPAATTPVNSYTGWQNPPPVLFSSTGTQSDVRNSSPSAGYTGASGNGNIFMGTASGNTRDLIIAGINTSAYTTVELSFGILSNTANSMVTVEYSTDGVSFTAMTVNNSIAANTWTLKTAGGTLPSVSNLYLKFSKNMAVQFRLDDIRLSGLPIAIPDIMLHSNQPALPAANVIQGSIYHPIYQFDLTVTKAPAILTGLSIQTLGSYTAADIDSIQCWYSADASWDAATDVRLSVKTSSLGPGTHIFPSFISQVISTGQTAYFFITASVPCSATIAHSIAVNAIGTADLSFSSGNISGTAYAGGEQTIIAANPQEISGFSATVGNTVAFLNWSNPSGCYDEIMIIGAASVANSGIPSGDGSSYAASLVFGNGSVIGNGFVLYKGNAAPQTLSGLNNGSTYYLKAYTRLGTQWSSGTEIPVIPIPITSASDHFRSAVRNGDWDQAVSWESSPDGTGNWISATISPLANASTIRILSGDTIRVMNNLSIDQIRVEAGASLVLNANFNLSDAPGATDLEVYGLLLNQSGTHSFTGTVVFGAGSIYQHHRNAGAIPPANWDPSSTVLMTGISSTAPGGLGQVFGNFHWNCPGQTASVNLSGGLTQLAGNLVISHCSATAGRVLRMTGTATNPVLDIGGDFIINHAHARFEFGNGSATGAQMQIGGSFLISAGTFNANVNGSMQVLFTGQNRNFNQSGDNFNGSQVNWQVQNGASLNMLSNIPVAAGRTLTVNGTLDANQLQVTGAGNIQINGTLVTAHSNGISNTGTLANTGTVTIGAASLIHYQSSNAQQITGRNDYASILISGGGHKTLSAGLTMSGSLSLTDGKVFLGSHVWTMSNSSPGAITGYNANAYLVCNGTGGLTRAVSGAGAYVFPIGNNNHLQEASISFANPLPAPNTLSASFITANGGANGLPLTESGHLINRSSAFGYWQINAGTAFTDPYTGTFIAKGFGDIIDHSRLHLIKRADATAPWILDGVHVPTTGFNYLAVLQRNGMSGFSQFGVGGENNVSLPVKISRFTGWKEGKRNQLAWTTASEQDNRGFDIQRSLNGQLFSTIGWVESKAVGGNSPSSLSYHFTDHDPGIGLRYYRLRQRDSTGKEAFSAVVRIADEQLAGWQLERIMSQPARDQVMVMITASGREKIQICLYDPSGKMVFQRTVYVSPGSNRIDISISHLPSGHYRLLLMDEQGQMARAVLVRH